MHSILLKPRIDNLYELAEDYSFCAVKVPKGYISDGLSMPIWFRLFVNKYSARYIPAAIVHDYLTDQAFKEYTNDENLGKIMFRTADLMFKEMLTIADGGSLSDRSKVMILSVKLYHRIKYKVK